jgi:mannosyl-oligosaccharide glucosidase
MTDMRGAKESFETRFDSVLRPSASFSGKSYLEFSQALLSNLLAGLGYFYGNSKVDRSDSPVHEESSLNFWEEAAKAGASSVPQTEGRSELFTCVPSRSFFPRGFLWDEGFHQLMIIDWDIDLTMQVLDSWLSLMDDDGWIAREQILGEEARSKVPPEFQVQHPTHANPPTIFLVLDQFIDIISKTKPYFGHPSRFLENPAAGREWLIKAYPKLTRHYDWFRRTQRGSFQSPTSKPVEGYRWRGRTPQHTLASGLDDYPRAVPPHPGELHVDALSWVGTMATSMERISKHLGLWADADSFATQVRNIKTSIDNTHWSTGNKTYCDTTIVDGRREFVCEKGYVSLFPFLLGLVGQSNARFGAFLDIISDETELWSPFGIRSLSRKNPHYGKDENYWRGPIWININYLIIQRLLQLCGNSPMELTVQTSGQNQRRACQLYGSLRRNVVNTVFESWRTTNSAWEQYNPDTGAGQRTQHFTGWTALVAKIMAMPDVEIASSGEVYKRPVVRKSFAEGRPRWTLPVIGTAMLLLVIGVRRKSMRFWRRIISRLN